MLGFAAHGKVLRHRRIHRVGHFKQKFCPSCLRDGVYLDASHVRAITAGADESLNNPELRRSWAETDGGIEYRLINQTAKCFGPAMLVARDADSAGDAREYALPPRRPRGIFT